ncbi:hypothetical protein BB558_006951, partial [Smittium angustum]
PQIGNLGKKKLIRKEIQKIASDYKANKKWERMGFTKVLGKQEETHYKDGISVKNTSRPHNQKQKTEHNYREVYRKSLETTEKSNRNSN